MPCDVRWLEKPYVFTLTLAGVVSDEEFHQLANDVIALLDEGGKVDAITLLDVTDLKKLPSLNVLRRELSRIPAHFDGQELGLSVAYGMSTLIRYVVELVMRVTPMRFKFLDSAEEAEMFVWQMIEIAQQSEADVAD